MIVFDSAFFRIVEKSGGGPKTKLHLTKYFKETTKRAIFLLFFEYRYLKDIYNVKSVYFSVAVNTMYIYMCDDNKNLVLHHVLF